ncbi:hypothetical protein GGR56DRAFT_671493 [Xylariaceae sp. FL0804]|nr:hypothetical protein GGR56DRAFT_671493 [Xylariaceae sp. FL0804]
MAKNVECDFLAAAQQESASPAPRPGGGLSSSSSGGGGGGDLNLADLELLHNYSVSTYTTLTENAVMREFYRITAVQLGFRCDYVMRTLLAVSALHLAHYRPAMREYYQSLAVAHHQNASRVAMALMADINPDRATNLTLFSILTIFFAFACPRKEEGSLLVGESGFPDWMFLLQGTRALIGVAGVQSDGPLAPVFSYGVDRWWAAQSRPEYQSPAHVQLESLKGLVAQREKDEKLVKIYSEAIEELHKSFTVLDTRHDATFDLTDAFVWVFTEAVAIFAFFCVLLKRLEKQWWLAGWADHLIAKSFYLLDEEHRLWIRWPLEEIGWVP